MHQRGREWREEDWEHERSRPGREPWQRESWGRGPFRESQREPWSEPRMGQEWRGEDDPRSHYGPQFGQRGSPYYGQQFGPGQGGRSGGYSGGWGGSEEWHDYPQSSYSPSNPYSQSASGGYPQYGYPQQYGAGQYGGGGQYGSGQYGSGMGRMQRSGQYPYMSPYREQGSYGEESRRGESFMPRHQELGRSGQEWAGGSRAHELPGGSFEGGYGREGSTMVSGGRWIGRGPKGYQRSDERIREDVCDRLIAADVDCEEIEIKVKDGEVMLTGTTRSGESRREIERLAEGVSGVKDVTNQIRMKRDDENDPSRRGSSQSSSSRTTGTHSGTQNRTG